MRNIHVIVTALVLFFSATFVFAQSDLLIWNGNSEELVKFIKSNDENKKVFAQKWQNKTNGIGVSVQDETLFLVKKPQGWFIQGKESGNSVAD